MDDSLSWKDALVHLYEAGWDGDDIDAACDSLLEACDSNTDLGDLRFREIEEILDQELEREDAAALIVVAEVRADDGRDHQMLCEALDDLKAYARAYAAENG